VTVVTERDSGSVFDDKYEIVQRLGAGGMGEVYRTRHIHLHEDRVIKILRGDKATDPHAFKRFQQEARIAAQVKHPNVAILYDFAQLPDGSFYMVWEFIAGQDVDSALRAHGPFRMSLAVEMAIQALRGLDAIHSAGVIHRDISPDNLMIARDRRDKPLVKIIDLGLAKDLEAAGGSEITQAGMFMGKLMYCSPEQAGSMPGAKLDHRSDLYSLAAVLYEMVTGKPPFDSESEHGFALRRLSEEPISMIGRTSGITVPGPLNEVVMRALERDREERWPDALSFLRALVRVADHLRQVSTQEIPAQKRAGAEVEKPNGTGVSPRAASRSSSGELSHDERFELLAQIDRAAKRVSDAGQLQKKAESALREGRREEASEIVSQLEALSPRFAGLTELRVALAAPRSGVAAPKRPAAPPQAPAPAPSTPAEPSAEEIDRDARIAEAERLLDMYIREHKQSLARFALDALLDLKPNHPKRADFEAWVELLGEESEQLESAREALEEGRSALLRDDLDGARAQLSEIEERDPTHRLPDLFRTEIEEAESRMRSVAELDRRRNRIEELLEGRRLKDAEKELERLSAAGLARVSIESYRLRISDIAALAEQEVRAQEFEKRYRKRVSARDWAGAREVVLEFEGELPDAPQLAGLFAEVSRLEEVQRKHKGVEQGVRQLEEFISQKNTDGAETTLRILTQMAPDLPELERLGRRVRAMRES
jgi:serine/threonine-protein kinase